MKSLAIIRSNPLSAERVRECAEQFEDSYIHLNFKWWDPDPGDGHVSDFIVDQLFDVRDFGIVYAVDVWFHADSFDEYSKVEAIRRFFDADSSVHWRELWSASEQARDSEAARKAADNYSELSIGCGRSHFGYYCCFDPLVDSPAYKDKRYRKVLLEKAILSIGGQEKIRAYFDEKDNLRMTAEQPWRLTHFTAEMDGANPSGFNVNGFENAEKSIRAALAMLQGVATFVGSGMIRAGLPILTYERIFPRLNRIARGWRITISGERDGTAARRLDDQDSLESGKSGRYPAFSWWEHKYGPDVIGSVVVQNGACFLELATEGGGIELLKERALVLDNVEFNTLFP